MFFREIPGFKRIIEETASEHFLQAACGKYHYLPADKERLWQVADSMKSCMAEDAFWQHRMEKRDGILLTAVVMTLGKGVDMLQEKYVSSGYLTEGYMIDALAGEILLRAYRAYNDWVAEHTSYHVARYYFLGSEKAYPMELLPELLKELDVPVACNEGYCMMPKESVAFYALLTKEEGMRCRGICMDCRREDCPNRVSKKRPMTYGYARIFGREFL